MELTEKIETINRQLTDTFGIDTITGLSMWRVVWSEDQLEKRLSNYTASGIELLTPMVIEAPKYRQWIQQRYILERLTLVPDFQQEEIGGMKLSYEPLYTFETKHGNYLPPRFDVCQFVIDAVYAAQGKTSLSKYKDPDAEEGAQEKRVNEICDYLYGDETNTSDAFAHGEAIAGFHQKIKES